MHVIRASPYNSAVQSAVERRILVVDDSAFARRKLREVLGRAGYIVDEAGSGLEALEKYSLCKPHAVLLDIVMEGMDGVEALARLRALDPNANVIVATADIQSRTRDEVFRLGAADLVNKPFDAAEVLAALERVTQHAQG